MTTFDHLRAYIREQRKSGESWDAIAKSFGHSRITKGHVWKIYNKGWEPDDPELRLILSLPAFKPMPICPVHGVVHDYDCRTQVVKPLPRARKSRPARIAIRKDDMQSAANTITNNLSSGQVRLLVVKLLLKLKENER
jgi:hypothetical protein